MSTLRLQPCNDNLGHLGEDKDGQRMIEIPYCADLCFVVTIYKVVKTFPVFLSGPKVSNNIMFWWLGWYSEPVKQTSQIETFYEYQPSGAGGTRSPTATPHRLQNPKWLTGDPKMADVVWKWV